MRVCPLNRILNRIPPNCRCIQVIIIYGDGFFFFLQRWSLLLVHFGCDFGIAHIQLRDIYRVCAELAQQRRFPRWNQNTAQRAKSIFAYFTQLPEYPVTHTVYTDWKDEQKKAYRIAKCNFMLPSDIHEHMRRDNQS